MRLKNRKSPLENRLFMFKSHPRGAFDIWHLLKLHVENRHKKSQKPCGIWDFCCGIYLGCTIWLREWDLNHTTLG